jgi:phosphatidylglycerol:prolipoprotein diacylglycerol transferase
MYPVLFKIPLSEAVVRWGPVILALALAVYLVTRLIGKERDVTAAVISGVIGAALVGFRFYVLAKLHPEWAQIGHVSIYSYGVMLGLSLVAGWYLTLGLAEKDGLPKETMANNYVVTAVAAIIGSRVLYILTNFSEFEVHVKDAQGLEVIEWGASIANMFAMRKGGLVAYGGFLGGLAGSYFFLRRHKIPLLPWADVAVPSLASGLMITRIGCYLFGCDFGHPLQENAPAFLKKLGSFPHWAKGTIDAGDGSPAWVQHVKHNGLSMDATHSLPVHPTQIYESLVGAGLLALLLWARRRQKFRGEIFFLFAFAYGVARFLLEILRDDEERGNVPPSLPEHVLLPGALAILAIGWVIGFSKAIKDTTLQRLTQVLAFVPAVAVYLAMRPESFAGSVNVSLSTSQFIALVSGFAGAAAFAVFYKVALAHPEQAMALGLPATGPLLAGDEGDEEKKAAPAAEDGEEDRAVVKKPAKKKGTKKKKAKVDDDEVGEVLAKVKEEHVTDEDTPPEPENKAD